MNTRGGVLGEGVVWVTSRSGSAVSATVSPPAQDDTNKNGGKWMVRLKKGIAARCWENLVSLGAGPLHPLLQGCSHVHPLTFSCSQLPSPSHTHTHTHTHAHAHARTLQPIYLLSFCLTASGNPRRAVHCRG